MTTLHVLAILEEVPVLTRHDTGAGYGSDMSKIFQTPEWKSTLKKEEKKEEHCTGERMIPGQVAQ